MYERFTGRARRVVVLAQEEARMLNHNYIGTEHILLGPIGEGEGVAAQVLVELGADPGHGHHPHRAQSLQASPPGTGDPPDDPQERA